MRASRRSILRSSALALLAALLTLTALPASHQITDGTPEVAFVGELPTPEMIGMAWHPAAGTSLALAGARTRASHEVVRTPHVDAGRLTGGAAAIRHRRHRAASPSVTPHADPTRRD